MVQVAFTGAVNVVTASSLEAGAPSVSPFQYCAQSRRLGKAWAISLWTGGQQRRARQVVSTMIEQMVIGRVATHLPHLPPARVAEIRMRAIRQCYLCQCLDG